MLQSMYAHGRILLEALRGIGVMPDINTARLVDDALAQEAVHLAYRSCSSPLAQLDSQGIDSGCGQEFPAILCYSLPRRFGPFEQSTSTFGRAR